MGVWSWIVSKLAPAPAALSNGQPITKQRPLWEQFQRIGGGLTPQDVSWIIMQADAGSREKLVDLFNESRQKDGHFQGLAFTRETAASLVNLTFIAVPNETRKEAKARALCEQLVAEFRNWSTMLEHLNGNGVWFGDGCVELLPWEQTEDGYLIPKQCKQLHARDFFFRQDTGELRYRRSMGDSEGVDIAAENPGRVIQSRRRINGDVPTREGLCRVLIWSALFRNWDLRDWIALGEVGWKPRLWGKYPDGANDADQTDLLRRLETIAERGIGVIPQSTDVDAKYPTGSSQTGVHKELFGEMGREMSKAVLGQTTSIELGPNGARADTEARDVIRTDIQETDLTALAGDLLWQLFKIVVELNFGPKVRCPVPYFETDESEDKKDFASAIASLKAAGLRIPADWVRDEFGMPDPLEDEEIVGGGEGDKGTIGAQTDAVTKLMTLVATGQIPRESAINTLVLLFGYTVEDANALMSNIGLGFVPAPPPGTEPTEPAPAPNPDEPTPEPSDSGTEDDTEDEPIDVEVDDAA